LYHERPGPPTGPQHGPIGDIALYADLFSFSLPARVNFVGGGGKTSLILNLLEEFAASSPAVYTTTTRIHPPHPTEGLVVISSDNEDHLVMLLERAASGWCCGRRFVVAHLLRTPDLLPGVGPAFARRLDPALIPIVLNEADGARSMSLKMPREGEPVLLEGANYLVPVVGLDCLNRPLGPDTLFRWDYAAARFHLRPGKILTPEAAAAILLHPEGVCKDWQPDVRIIPFINKVDFEADDHLARALAFALFNNGSFPIDRVVWGSLRHARGGIVTGASA
jgi:probable selenium-dependent hydroxylase accessory protein YqeC